MSASLSTFPITKSANGVSVVKFSRKNMMVAVGTAHGDVLVYDIGVSPWRLLRIVHNESKHHDGIINLSWSLDDTLLTSINQLGTLVVWSMHSGGILRSDLKGLDIKPDSQGYVPEQLTPILSMDMEQLDFTFQTGPLSELGTHDKDVLYGPALADFYPSLSFAATQFAFCASLDNGDIVKFDMETKFKDDAKTTPRILYSQVTQGRVNTLGQEVEGELFRGHKHPLVFLGFINHIGNMISVDIKGYIFIWRYRRKEFSEFGWFRPFKKYRLSLSKAVYFPAPNTKANVMFSDRKKPNAKALTRQELARERRKGEELLAQANMGDMWHKETDDENGLLIQYFKPGEMIHPAGSLFHITVRYKLTDQLSSYSTQLYKPEIVKSSKFVACIMNTTATALIFVILFPAYFPKEPHLCVVILDVDTMRMRDYRCDIRMPEADYNQLLLSDLFSADVTKCLGSTGAEYLIINIAGRLYALSLNSGSFVMRMEDAKNRIPDYVGLRLNSNSLHIAAEAQVAVGSSFDKVHIIIYATGQHQNKLQNQVTVITLQDKNPAEECRPMHSAYNIWSNNKPLPPREQRIENITFMLRNNEHPWIAMRRIILRAMDRALQQVDGEFSPEQLQENVEIDELENYRAMLYSDNAQEFLRREETPDDIVADEMEANLSQI